MKDTVTDSGSDPSYTVSGGVFHYPVKPDLSISGVSAISVEPPSEAFRNFVRDLGFESVSAAVELGQFRHQLEQTLKDKADQRD